MKAAEFYLHKYTQTYNEKGLAQSKLWGSDTLCITIAANIADSAIMSISGCFPDSIVGFVANPTLADVRFVKYYIDTLKHRMEQASRGTTQDNLSLEKLMTFDILVPPLPFQQGIADILAAYDDLIENNTRRIAILEEMARNLFREWFVDFRFPGHEQVATVESELGLIPEGWKTQTLEGVLNTLEAGTRPRGGIDPEERAVPSVGAENILGLGRYDFGKEKFVSRAFFDGMSRGRIENGDILLYKDGAQIGRKSLFRDGFPHAECCVNEHVFILRTNGRSSQNYLFLWLDRSEMTERIKSLNSNAAQPGINQVGVKGLPILLPPVPLLDQFERLVEPSMALLFNLARKNRVLTRTRDLLLPKLITGEITLGGN